MSEKLPLPETVSLPFKQTSEVNTSKIPYLKEVGIGLAIGTAAAVVLFEVRQKVKPILEEFVGERRNDAMLRRIHEIAIP